MFFSSLVAFLAAAVKAGTPLLFGTTGEVLTERAGRLNLGVEGMMLMGAFAGFYAGFATGSVPLALLAAFAAGMLGALIYAFLTVTLKANQTVTGLALTIFGSGFAQFFGQLMVAATSSQRAVLPDAFAAFFQHRPLPLLGGIPWVGPLLFSYNLLVYLAFAVAIVCGVYLRWTRPGQHARAVGENPAAADAAGLRVVRIQYLHILIGGGICALGGAYLAIDGKVWNAGCVNGQGWIAVALVIFASWSPFKAMIGSFLFGMFSVLRLYISAFVEPWPALAAAVAKLPQAFYDMLPFLFTAVVLVVGTIRRRRSAQPAALGVNYFREER